jgi:hypothetical protein
MQFLFFDRIEACLAFFIALTSNPGNIYYKTFTAAIKARVFAADSHFHLGLIFEGKAPSGAPLR